MKNDLIAIVIFALVLNLGFAGLSFFTILSGEGAHWFNYASVAIAGLCLFGFIYGAVVSFWDE